MRAEFPTRTELRWHGIDAENASGHARDQAILHGIRLCALSGNTWPAKNDGLYHIVTAEIITEITSFAIHARRYMELTGVKDLRADGPLLRIKLPDFHYETSVWTAVNRIVHAEQMEVFSVSPVTTKHSSVGDLIIANVKVTSPQRDAIAVCPQGLFYGFATSPLTREPEHSR